MYCVSCCVYFYFKFQFLNFLPAHGKKIRLTNKNNSGLFNFNMECWLFLPHLDINTEIQSCLS